MPTSISASTVSAPRAEPPACGDGPGRIPAPGGRPGVLDPGMVERIVREELMRLLGRAG